MIRKSTGYTLMVILGATGYIGLVFMQIHAWVEFDRAGFNCRHQPTAPILMNLGGKTITAFFMTDDQGRVLESQTG